MYIVIESQKSNGVISTITNTYEDMPTADNKYYTILAAAAISSVEKHGAILLDEECHLIRNDCYIHN